MKENTYKLRSPLTGRMLFVNLKNALMIAQEVEKDLIPKEWMQVLNEYEKQGHLVRYTYPITRLHNRYYFYDKYDTCKCYSFIRSGFAYYYLVDSAGRGPAMQRLLRKLFIEWPVHMYSTQIYKELNDKHGNAVTIISRQHLYE